MFTDREKQILKAIISYIDKNEFIPTVREISNGVRGHRGTRKRLRRKSLLQGRKPWPGR